MPTWLNYDGTIKEKRREWVDMTATSSTFGDYKPEPRPPFSWKKFGKEFVGFLVGIGFLWLFGVILVWMAWFSVKFIIWGIGRVING